MTMFARPRSTLLVSLALALSGCGGGGSAGNAGGAGWKATDACALLDTHAVAATLGAQVASAKLDAVKQEGGGFDLYSQCTYQLADGRMLVFGTGQATNGASVADQVARIRGQLGQVATKPIVDLPGIGKAALWSAELKTVYAFFGDGKFASALVGNPNFRAAQASDEKIRDDEVAILRKAGG